MVALPWHRVADSFIPHRPGVDEWVKERFGTYSKPRKLEQRIAELEQRLAELEKK